MIETAKKKTIKLIDLEGLVDTKELANKYKLTEEKIIKRINELIEEEKSLNEEKGLEPLDENTLKDLVMRSFRLEMKSHLVSKAVPVRFKVIAKKEPFDYAKKKISDLKKLFSIDPKTAMTEGSGDAICNQEGEVIYNEAKTFNRGPYPEHKYIYTIILLVKRLDLESEESKKFGLRSLSFKQYEGEDLEFYNALEEEHWYDSKLIIDEYKEDEYNLTGKFSSVSEIDELDEKEQEKLNEKHIYANISPKKGKDGKVMKDDSNKIILKNEGLIFENELGEHRLDLKDGELYYEKFVDNGYMPVERYVAIVADVVSISDSGAAISIVDKSIEDEDKIITVFDNRGDKSVQFGPRSKILIFGELNYDRKQKKLSINMVSVKIIPRELGGHFYPLKIEKQEKIEKKKPASKEKPKPKKTQKAEKTKDEKRPPKINQDLVSEEIQSKIVETIYTMKEGGTFDEILEKTDLEETEAFKHSFFDLVDREIFNEKDGVYEIY